MNQVVIIPVLDPSPNLLTLAADLQDVGFNRIVVVDDGSDPSSADMFSQLESAGCDVVHHETNRGKGAAIKTGIARMRALWPDAPAFVTVDGDGQHLPADVLRVARASEANPSKIVLGTRDFHAKGVPVRSKLGNAFSSLYFRIDTGVACSDTQTGLRAVPARLFSCAQECEGERYEYEMNFLTTAALQGVGLLAIPITTVYEDGNSCSHFDTIRDSYRIYRSFFRFAASSATCAIADLSLFALLVAALGQAFAPTVAIVASTIAARLVSGVLNFSLNRNWSFQRNRPGSGGSPQEKASGQAIRYGTLFVVQMGLSAAGTSVVSLVFPEVIAKVLVDGTLFFISYFVQRHWVFSREASISARAKRFLPASGASSSMITARSAASSRAEDAQRMPGTGMSESRIS